MTNVFLFRTSLSSALLNGTAADPLDKQHNVCHHPVVPVMFQLFVCVPQCLRFQPMLTCVLKKILVSSDVFIHHHVSWPHATISEPTPVCKPHVCPES